MFCPDCLLAPGPHPSSCVRLGQDPQGQRILLNVEGASLELEEALDRLREEGCPADDLKRIKALACLRSNLPWSKVNEIDSAIEIPESPETSSPKRPKAEPAVDSGPQPILIGEDGAEKIEPI